MKPSRSGMTLVEVLIALIVLGAGILPLAGSSAMVTRMIGTGKAETRAVFAASRRMEILRAAAHSTTPPCTAATFASGGPVQLGWANESWVVIPTGPKRRVTVAVEYLTPRGGQLAVLESDIEC